MWSATDMAAAMTQFAIVAGLMTLVPGLDVTLVLRTALTQPKRVAFAAAFGIVVGLLLWAVAAAAGLSALLSASELAFNAMRIGGALYMMFLGAKFFVDSTRHEDVPADLVPITDSGFSSFRRGLMTNVLNPKIGVFYLAMLPPFIPSGTNTVVAALVLASIHVVECLAYFSAIILAAQFFRQQFGKPTMRALVDRLAGVLIIGFGLRLLASGSST